MDFAAFFHDVHGVPALPWQTRLAQRLIDGHGWPDVIDLPTASGKTACIDIAVFHLAWCALHNEPWKAARRIVFVVDRRIIVDAAFERGERIRSALNDARVDSIRAVAEALGQLGGDAPLICQKLRGGMVREQSFTLNPAQPMVITSTIDQVGSRLLFRGYGLNPYAAPVHAGLLGHDTLILLDEAHLAGPFTAAVAGVVREQTRAECPLDPVQPVRLVQMSATVASTKDRFSMDEADRAHPTIAARLTAPKPARLVEAPYKLSERLKVLSRETLNTLKHLQAHTRAPAVAVIVNRVKTARPLFEMLRPESTKGDFDIDLLIGRSRPIDRDVLSSRLMARLGPKAEDASFERPVVVVATQTIEVGADLDFQGMITECAALAALRQRFGRLDRFGVFRQAQATIVGGGEPEDDPVYGPALAATWKWLNSVAISHEGTPCVNFSVHALDAALASTDVAPLAVAEPPILHLTPAFTQLLSQTAPRPAHEPDVPALLHGLKETEAEVQVVWRSDIPVRPLGENMVLDPEHDDAARELLEINPPASLEAMNLPLGAVRSWLESLDYDGELVDVEGLSTSEPGGRRAASASVRQVWQQTAEDWKRAFPLELRPGDTIVVPTCYGGCDEYGFSPDSREYARDLSPVARKVMGKSPMLTLTRWHAIGDRSWAEAPFGTAWSVVSQAVQEGKSDPDELIPLIVDSFEQSLGDVDTWLRNDPLVHLITKEQPGQTIPLALVITSRKPCRGDISDEDLSSSRTVPVSLSAHNAGVGQRARILAKAVGLGSSHVSTMGAAGDFHDIGKAEPRFQVLLRAGDFETLAGELLAKGLRRVRGARSESAERHEAYSVAFLKAHPELLKEAADPELALFLIGSHHGRGRALMPSRADGGSAFAVRVGTKTYEFEGAPGLGAVGSGWPSLFWRLNRRYGPWGLAYLESILRLADQLRSAEEIEGKV